jgi:hypothetical protein
MGKKENNYYQKNGMGDLARQSVGGGESCRFIRAKK